MSYFSGGKWRFDYLNDQCHRFEALRHISKSFHEVYVGSVSEAILEVPREIFSTFCGLFHLLNNAM